MSAETKQQYEGAILEQLVKNAERLAVVEQKLTVVVEQKLTAIETDIQELKTDVSDLKTLKTDVAAIHKTLNGAKWLLVTILVGIIINIFSQPVLSLLY